MHGQPTNGQSPSAVGLNLAALRKGLSGGGNREYWRSLDELAETPEFQEMLHREFPRQASEWNDPVGRRDFLKLMAASLALAGATGCTEPPAEKIVPYVRQPQGIVPGKPLFFATAMTLGGYARGVLVESHEGRPTKIEGNREHPASLGATDAFAQASILSLYDPDRSQTVLHRGQIDTWDRFLTAITPELARLREKQGEGLSILTETVTSPTLGAQIQALIADMPRARWRQYESAGRHSIRAGARLAFGRYVETVHRFDQADVILSLDSDFLQDQPGSLRYAYDFIEGRRLSTPDQAARPRMSRLYAVESTPTLTGAMADHKLPLRSSSIEGFLRSLAGKLGVELRSSENANWDERAKKYLDVIEGELDGARGKSIVVAGDTQPAAVHALAHALNQALGNVGKTVLYTEPVEVEPTDQLASIGDLVADMGSSRVELLVNLGGNPAYSTPAKLGFARHIQNVKLRVHLSDYYDETSLLSHWHIPAAHSLESWGDARAYDGTTSLLQPLIAPLYGGKSPHEVLAVLAGKPERTAFEIVQDYWHRQLDSADFASIWRQALHDGLIRGTEAADANAELSFSDPGPSTDGAPQGELEVVFRPDPSVWDGRFSNNGWLQELPKPLTKLTWDNAALIAPATAERYELKNGDVVELNADGQSVRAPIWIAPGHAPGAITLTLGYGRTNSGGLGTGIGYNALAIMPARPRGFIAAELRKTGEHYPLVTTQDHFSMEGRPLIQAATLEQYQSDRNMFRREEHTDTLPSLYPEYEYNGNKWGMIIDQNACIGCNACVAACQAENNIPIVGKQQVARGREMHWLRIDRYYKGLLDEPETYFQPLMCVHCENAPCELVCPVAATVHDSEGLNNMIYNRCVGTRYCSNNCPYKVRRFNFLQYWDVDQPSLKLLHNPEVTVRHRGVMEKCTYCVQRIDAARIEAKKANRAIHDGEVVTACQGACPTRAIVFGNLNDDAAEVTRLKESPLNYSLLGELNTRPRTTYLARIRNTNSDLQTELPGDTPQDQLSHPLQAKGAPT